MRACQLGDGCSGGYCTRERDIDDSSIADAATDRLSYRAYAVRFWLHVRALLRYLTTMNEDKSYYAHAVFADDCEAPVRQRKAKRADPKPSVEDRHEAVFGLSAEQYDDFERCMLTPTKPNAEMMQVAEEMLAF